MQLEISATNGNRGYVDNEGQINGQVKITGDEDLVRTLNALLNKDYEIPGIAAAGVKVNYPEELFFINNNKVLELWKASDKYIEDYFIPSAINTWGFTVKKV